MSFHPINSRTQNSCGLRPHRYVLTFGAYGGTVCLVWADHLENALDKCVDWIADNKPGLLCDEDVQQAYNEAITAGLSEEEAMEQAEQDTTCAGNSGHYLASGGWNLAAEDPDRKALKELVAQAACH